MVIFPASEHHPSLGQYKFLLFDEQRHVWTTCLGSLCDSRIAGNCCLLRYHATSTMTASTGKRTATHKYREMAQPRHRRFLLDDGKVVGDGLHRRVPPVWLEAHQKHIRPQFAETNRLQHARAMHECYSKMKSNRNFTNTHEKGAPGLQKNVL